MSPLPRPDAETLSVYCDCVGTNIRLLSGFEDESTRPWVRAMIAVRSVAVNMAVRSAALTGFCWSAWVLPPRKVFCMLKSKCSNCRPASSWDFTFEPMALTPVTMSWHGCGMMTLTSPFCSAGTSCVESEIAVKVILSKYGPEDPYHLGLGTSTTLVPSDAADWIRYGPSDQV